MQKAAINALVVQELNGKDINTLAQPERDRLVVKYAPTLVSIEAQLTEIDRKLKENWSVGAAIAP